jgi:prepilin-type N-terminal cleavage/methylation domain-containing protein
MHAKNFQHGFTLIEIAIVLLIVAIILGYTVAMLPIQQELKQYRSVNAEMDEIIQHLIGYAQVNGRLPCPDVDTDATAAVVSDGREDAVDVINNINTAGAAGDGFDGCTAYFGFLPNQTLGIYGKINANGNLIDPWGNPYGYAISNVDANSDGDNATFAGVDLVTPNGIRQEGLNNVIPDLFVCDDSAATGDDLGCSNSDPAPVAGTEASGNDVAANVAVVIISLGKNPDPDSNIQVENQDDFFNGGAGGLDGTSDKVYVSAGQSDQFDDVVKWIPYTLLYSKMIQAAQLP